MKNRSAVTRSASIRRSTMTLNASSTWPSVLALMRWACSPTDCAAAWTFAPSVRLTAVSGVTSTATVVALGTESRSSSSRFYPSGKVKNVTQVTLPLIEAGNYTGCNGCAAYSKDNGYCRGRRFCCQPRGGAADCSDNGLLEADQIRHHGR